ncbi:GntR family transcriptional regulator [Alicyclobacillus sendaiensis]|uniref:GntR family transcriptional regulator n=1 Tax=Alicyclobacillus sendaiensis PA2 TaxID=3029425 RepID=A0ABT6XYG8_ALISE|nr:GntR family transcriptional regulator [Alicyclobacillus sendaiensis]MDI9259832.1 GntR family transcriptional regulator [Alicyclobacillus sendaiensis PA2]
MRESVPLYQQLKSELLDKILSGAWPPGEQIPSEAELASMYDVSRTTVRQAVGDLVAAGFIVRRQGKGSFVADLDHPATSTTLYGFAEELRAAGLPVDVRLDAIEMRACPDDIARWLRVPGSKQVLYIERTAFVDDLAYFHERSYLVPPFQVSSRMAPDPKLYDSIYGFFEQNGVRINSGSQTISAELADPDDCARFGLRPPAAVLCIERITRDESGAPVEYSLVRYPSDRYQLRVQLLRHPH